MQQGADIPNSHEAAVWSISWAHPKYGSILASSSYDGKVFIWREQAGVWQRLFDFALHKASVNLVAWSPHEAGCLLACASSDGAVSVLEFKDNSYEHTTFPAHSLGVNGVSWAPASSAGSLISSNPSPSSAGNRRFVTGGSDNVLRIWAWDASAGGAGAGAGAGTGTSSGGYVPEGEPLTGHTDWVRDVAWSPTVLQKSYIASASQDRTVRIWTADSLAPAANGGWTSKVLTFDTAVWRVNWSLSGNVLAVSTANNKITMWKENLKGEWECVKTMGL